VHYPAPHSEQPKKREIAKNGYDPSLYSKERISRTVRAGEGVTPRFRERPAEAADLDVFLQPGAHPGKVMQVSTFKNLEL